MQALRPPSHSVSEGEPRQREGASPANVFIMQDNEGSSLLPEQPPGGHNLLSCWQILCGGEAMVFSDDICGKEGGPAMQRLSRVVTDEADL